MSAASTTLRMEGPLPGSSQRVAGILCLIGFFLHTVLSDPVLLMLGFHYSGDTGGFYEKIHPGGYFVLLSLVVLLMGKGGPFRRFLILYRHYRIYMAFLLIHLMLFAYMTLRSGAIGLAFWIDTHLVTIICAIVLSCASARDCRRGITIFLAVATLNSLIGITESVFQFRIFTYDPTWGVLHEDAFRASALEGHPLNSGMFTSIAMFCVLGLHYKNWLKGVLIVIMIVSLVAFGGRVALAFSVLSVLFLGGRTLLQAVRANRMNLRQLLVVGMIAIGTPIALGAGLYMAINSKMGERIATHSQWDDSANSREIALQVFSYMTKVEMIFGIPTDRIVDIAYRMNLAIPVSDIENPWFLMFMYLGFLTFPIWLGMTGMFVWRLGTRQPFALKMVIISYFAIASTSNSFGRKDANYSIMVCAVVCASRSRELVKKERELKEMRQSAALPPAAAHRLQPA